ncbi:MAG: CRISPR-associated endoribonuclease Cas6 [Bacteroidota bacterium]
MRVRVTFKVNNKGAAIPFHHQFLIAQILKGLVVASGADQYNNYPYYSFSGLKGLTKVSREGLHYNSNRVTIVLTSPNASFVDFMINKIFEQDEIAIGSLVISPESVDQELSVDFGEMTKFICISPLVLLPASFNSNEGKQFIEPGTDEFSDLLFESTVKRMEEYGIDVDSIDNLQKFQVVPDLAYINKIRQSQKKFARVYSMFDRDVKYEVRGYTFPFMLYAPAEVQEFLFTCGLGHYSHKGFGMLDIANSDPTKRAVGYAVSSLISA